MYKRVNRGFIWFRFPKIMGLRTPDVDTLLLNNWEAGVEFRGRGVATEQAKRTLNSSQLRPRSLTQLSVRASSGSCQENGKHSDPSF